MKKIKTVLVDDEPLARERIRTLLQDEPDLELVAECENGAQAIEAVESLAPDLLFLDVQMPEIDGFDVLRALDRERLPRVVFVTAFDQYAVRAFDVHALDYLLKPFDRDRFREALQRARQDLAREEPADLRKQLDHLLDELKPDRRVSDRLLVKTEGRILFLRTAEIDWIEAAGNYVRIHQGAHCHLMRETMAGMEERLDPQRFVRIHRSTIVHFDRIKEMHPAFNNEYIVILHDGTELKLSRGYKSALDKRL